MSVKRPKPIEEYEAVDVSQLAGEPVAFEETHCVCDAGHCAIPEDEMMRNLLINVMDTTNIQDCRYNRHEFNKGVAEMSKTAGMITALVNAGLMPSEALEYICAMNTNDTTYKLQTELSKQSNDANIAIAKISGETAMKQQF